MKTAQSIQLTVQNAVAVLAVVGAGLFGVSAAAQTGTFTLTNESPSRAAAEMSQHYGISIVYKSTPSAGQPVTLSIDNPDTPEGRLQAISELANATGMDFQKVFVVSKISAGTTVPEVKLDSDGPIVFKSMQTPVRDAIQTVAAVDNALVQISDSVSGTVTLPRTRLSAMTAAAVIARQTGTTWKVYYGLYRRGEAPPRFGGTVLGRTASGQPLTESPLLTFRNATSHPVPLITGAEAVVGPFAQPGTDPNVATVANSSVGAYPDLGYGPYGYNPYGMGYNPYVNGSFGYLAPNGSVAVPGTVYTPGVGTAPVVPGSNAPGVNAANGTNGTTVVLPNTPPTGDTSGE